MNEAKRLLSVLICSFSWVLMAWMFGSISRFRGARRLLLTFTAVIGGEISGLEPQQSLETIPERVRGFLLFLLTPAEEWLLNDLTVFFVFSISAVRVGEKRMLRGWVVGWQTCPQTLIWKAGSGSRPAYWSRNNFQDMFGKLWGWTSRAQSHCYTLTASLRSLSKGEMLGILQNIITLCWNLNMLRHHEANLLLLCILNWHESTETEDAESEKMNQRPAKNI